MNKILESLSYAKTHEWVHFMGDTTARVGISDFAQHELGDIVFVNLPEAGDTVTAGEAFGDVESVKAVSDVLSPVTGVISAVNQDALDHPESINENPYDSWLIEVKEITAEADLMTAAEYDEFCGKEAH
ncbi:MAG: glycine cleavage system protein GcvH [Tannerella sp.]|jgi:glycine cleavage system H protein|nr:glycine cleavage system protein GcvH [Tannerella sp.]